MLRTRFLFVHNHGIEHVAQALVQMFSDIHLYLINRTVFVDSFPELL
jgi:hypothetical protein